MTTRSPNPFLLASLLALGPLACVLLGEDEGSGDACRPGTELCECLGGVVCNGDLTCVGGYCIVPGSDPVTGGPAGTGGPGGGTDEGPTGPTSPADGDSSGSADGDSTTTGGPATGGMEDGGPTIVEVSTSAASMTQGGAVTITATVTDPQGPDDIVGGVVTSPDGSLEYGAFGDDGGGSYSMVLTWAAVNQAQVLEFDGVETRTFRLEFADATDKVAWQTVDLDFTCASGCAEWGACVDTSSDDDNCGACGNACTTFDKGLIQSGHCVDGTCTSYFSDCYNGAIGPLTCEIVCSQEGRTCDPAGCNDVTTLYYLDDTCTTYYTNTNGGCGELQGEFSPYYRCCCSQ